MHIPNIFLLLRHGMAYRIACGTTHSHVYHMLYGYSAYSRKKLIILYVMFILKHKTTFRAAAVYKYSRTLLLYLSCV